MNYKSGIIKSLARDLEGMGYSSKAEKLKEVFNKHAFNSEVSKKIEEINTLKEKLGPSVEFIEFFPVGSGQIPSKEELAVFYCGDNFSEIESIRQKLEQSNLIFQSVQTLEFFKSTTAGLSSTAIEKLDDKPCYVLTVTIELKPDQV